MQFSTHSRGINVIGDTTSNTGLGEATRATLDTIIKAKTPVSYIEFNYNFHKQEKDSQTHRYNTIKKGSLYDVNLMLYNIYDFNLLEDEKLRALTHNKYTIAHWVWEQTAIPKQLHHAFYHVDEIWTPSQYCQQAFASVRPIPVRVVPYPIVATISKRITNTQLDVPEDRFTFLFSFSAPSTDARKNPLELIQAFRNAFPKDSPQSPVLILKVHHLNEYPEYATYLKNELSTINSILIEDSLSRQDMNNLLASIDCYISLHRAEGFGLGMAEAMALGKPVIATNYSGNTDFMNTTNSFLVNYTLRPMIIDDFVHQPEKAGVYELGHLWADPDLEHTAELMQLVVSNPELAAERGRNAKAHIHAHFSPDAVGHIIQQRLHEIDPQNRNTLKSYQAVAKSEGEIMTQEPPTQHNTYDDLVNVLQETKRKYHQWDYRRVPETRHRAYQLPVLGYFLRILGRIKNLGKLWADLKFLMESQQFLNAMMVDRLESVQSNQQAINQLTVDMKLHNQYNARRLQQNQQHTPDMKQHHQQIAQHADDAKLSNQQIEQVDVKNQQRVPQKQPHETKIETYNRILKPSDYTYFSVSRRKDWEVQMYRFND
jgi:glycosyltransferase involved in cell wall biosynthesis